MIVDTNDTGNVTSTGKNNMRHMKSTIPLNRRKVMGHRPRIRIKHIINTYRRERKNASSLTVSKMIVIKKNRVEES